MTWQETAAKNADLYARTRAICLDELNSLKAEKERLELELARVRSRMRALTNVIEYLSHLLAGNKE